MTANKRGKKLKNNNAGYIIEVVILTAAAVFLSVISSAMFIDLIGFFCIVAASALFSCVLFLTKSRIMIPAAVISFAVAFILTENIISACASLIYIIIGAFIYFGVKSKKKRTQITVGIAVALTVFYIVMLVASVVLSTGAFSVGAVVSSVDEDLTSGLESYINQYSAVFQQYSELQTAETDAERAAYFEGYKKELVMNIKAILPSCFILYNLLIAYLSTALFKSAYNIFIPMTNPGRKRIKNKYWRINISVISAIIMIISIFLTMMLMFSPGDNLLAYIVMTNLVCILLPGFCVMGIYSAYDKMFKTGSAMFPVMLIAGTVILAFVFPFALFASMTFFLILGLYSALIDELKKFYEKTKKLLLGDDDDDDDDYLD